MKRKSTDRILTVMIKAIIQIIVKMVTRKNIARVRSINPPLGPSMSIASRTKQIKRITITMPRIPKMIVFNHAN